MTKIEMVKKVGAIVVSVGVGAIIGNVVKSTSPTQINILKKVCIGVGSLVLTSMISDKAVEYVETKIDDGIKQVKSMINEV